MAAHHHLRLHDTATLPVPPLAGIGQGSAWLLGAPLAFYLAWQATYFVLVQVAARPLIQAQGLDTSYRCLTRRARRARNVWARLVLRGSTARRLAVYGAVQLGYTAGTLLLFLPTYYFPALAFAWQAVKFLAPGEEGSTRCSQAASAIPAACGDLACTPSMLCSLLWFPEASQPAATGSR